LPDETKPAVRLTPPAGFSLSAPPAAGRLCALSGGSCRPQAFFCPRRATLFRWRRVFRRTLLFRRATRLSSAGCRAAPAPPAGAECPEISKAAKAGRGGLPRRFSRAALSRPPFQAARRFRNICQY